mmetsp:Transcript_6642/g.15917  ORF Transcript_6642/g.15917 Transcript_6642/m.15917 type:complete len:135 (-) Transcript_6642:253-657(-)
MLAVAAPALPADSLQKARDSDSSPGSSSGGSTRASDEAMVLVYVDENGEMHPVDSGYVDGDMEASAGEQQGVLGIDGCMYFPAAGDAYVYGPYGEYDPTYADPEYTVVSCTEEQLLARCQQAGIPMVLSQAAWE